MALNSSPVSRNLHLKVTILFLELEDLLAIMLAVFAALAFTRIGKAMRASADNPELAALKGIRPQRVAMIREYVGRIYEQVRERPRYVVQATLEKKE